MTAAKKAVLITHGGDGPQDADHASRTLAQLGYELDWRMPDQGSTLPKVDESIAVTVIYGGGKPADERDWYTDHYPWLHAEIAFAKDCVAKGVPTVGFCLGGQIIAHGLGSIIGPSPQGHAEFGYYELTPTEAGKALSRITFESLRRTITAFRSRMAPPCWRQPMLLPPRRLCLGKRPTDFNFIPSAL